MDENELELVLILHSYVDCLNPFRASIDASEGFETDNARRQDEGTIREVIHHTADGDQLWKTCILMAPGESERPLHLKWHWETDQIRWSHLWEYACREIETSLALLPANRNQTVELLREVPRSLSRTIIVEWLEGDQKEVSEEQMLEMQTNHVEHHAVQIRRLGEVSDI